MKGTKRIYVLALLIAAIPPFTAIINPQIVAYIVDSFVMRDGGSTAVHTAQEVLPPLLMMVGVHVFRMLCYYVSIMLTEHASQVMVINIRTRLFANILDEEMEFFQKHRTGDLMTRFTGDLDMCRHCVAYILRNLINNILVFFVAFTFLMTVNWRMTLIVTAVLPLIVVLRSVFTKRARHLFVELRERLSILNTTAQENIEGNRVVRAFAREGHEIAEFGEKNADYRDINLAINRVWFMIWPFFEGISQSLTISIALVGGIFAIRGHITVGQLAAFNTLGWALADPMRMLGMLFNDLERFFTSASKVIELFYAKPTTATRPGSEKPEEAMKGEIELRGVTFAYDRTVVLKDVNLHIKAGETVAIMGETGSGKTTLLNLIPRFYDVQEGAVLIDGKDVRDYPLHDLRGSIGIATQDVFLFSDTVEGNIAYGDLDLPVPEVLRFAEMADADSFIQKMPEGYETIIGERGVGLSGGQRQRIALARAMAVSPGILILDDTTSAVDLETEKYIQQQLREIQRPCTKLIVAQRISSVKDADKIIVLAGGAIAEMGTHEELLALDGYYSEIYAMQNEGALEPSGC